MCLMWMKLIFIFDMYENAQADNLFQQQVAKYKREESK